MTTADRDIHTREDIVCLVDYFYEGVRGDDILGPIFGEVAHVDWGEHLPKMYDFWEAVLFGSSRFKGDPLAVHRALASLAPLGGQEFGRWLHLFDDTVNTLFRGPNADDAKLRAARIAAVMQHHILADHATAPL